MKFDKRRLWALLFLFPLPLMIISRNLEGGISGVGILMLFLGLGATIINASFGYKVSIENFSLEQKRNFKRKKIIVNIVFIVIQIIVFVVIFWLRFFSLSFQF